MNTTTYNYQAELAEGLRNLARIEASRQEMDALRAKYAYADTPEYNKCDECGADNAGWPVEDIIVCGACFESYE